MRVLVCGGRDFENREAVFSELDALAAEHGWLTIIEGGARGADRLAREWAIGHYHGLVTFLADWAKNGKSAGYIRNTKMLVSGKPDMVLAFPGGAGTADMVAQARKAGGRVVEVDA